MDFYDEKLQRLFVLCKNHFFKNISDDLREEIFKKIISILKFEYYDFEIISFNHEEYCIFSEYLKSNNLSLESLRLINLLCTDIEDYNDIFINCTEDTFVLAWENCKKIVDSDINICFLYNASAFGFTKLLEKQKDIKPYMLSELLYFAIAKEYGHKVSLKAAFYLIEEFGINNFTITPEILKCIKENNSPKVLLVLLKNKENLSNIYWKEWFKNVNEFSDIIVTYCNDVIFSIMPYEYKTLLVEFIEARKQYCDVILNENCNKFKEFASEY